VWKIFSVLDDRKYCGENCIRRGEKQVWEEVTFLNKMGKRKFTDILLSKDLKEVWGQALRLFGGNLDKGNINCKGPEAVTCLACSKKSKESSMAAEK
jgi:hypothetical protein